MSQPHRYPQDSVFHCMKKYIHKAAFKIILPAFDVIEITHDLEHDFSLKYHFCKKVPQ